MGYSLQNKGGSKMSGRKTIGKGATEPSELDKAEMLSEFERELIGVIRQGEHGGRLTTQAQKEIERMIERYAGAWSDE
jgi:hypothetical protein